MECSLLDGGDYGEHTGIGFVEVYKTYPTQDAFFVGTILFDGVFQAQQS